MADTVGTLTLANCGTSGTGCPGARYDFGVSTAAATLAITIKGLPTPRTPILEPQT